MRKEDSLKNSNSILEKLRQLEIIGQVHNPVLEGCVVSGGERSTVSAIASCSYCCGSSTASMDRNR
jgi:hypothetical protein